MRYQVVNLIKPSQQTSHYSLKYLSWFHRQGVHINPLPLDPGYKDYSFLDQEVEGFEHGLDSILTDSPDTPELDASFDDADAVPSSVSSGFLHLS